MTATDELRRMLDERGVEWCPSAWDRSTETYWKTAMGDDKAYWLTLRITSNIGDTLYELARMVDAASMLGAASPEKLAAMFQAVPFAVEVTSEEGAE